MELFEAIKKRHSYRGPMSKQKIPRSDLISIVQAGLQAPSGRNYQSTEFVIIDDPEILAQLHTLHPTNLAMQQAPAMIACIVNTRLNKSHEEHDFEVEDCAAAVENMLLAITAVGYASVWIDGWLRQEERAVTIGRWLKLPADKKIKIILPIGIPLEEWQQKERKDFKLRAWFNLYPTEAQ